MPSRAPNGVTNQCHRAWKTTRQAVLQFVDKLEELKPTIRVVMPEFRGTEDREQLIQALWQVATIPSTETEEVPDHG